MGDAAAPALDDDPPEEEAHAVRVSCPRAPCHRTPFPPLRLVL